MSSSPKLIRKIEQLELFDQHTVVNLVRACTPLYDVDFDTLRHALVGYCQRWQVASSQLFSISYSGVQIYNLDGKTIEYTPSDHPMFILWHKPDSVDPGRLYRFVFACPLCGKPVTTTNQRDFPLLTEDVVLIGCPATKSGVKVWAQPYGYCHLDSVPLNNSR